MEDDIQDNRKYVEERREWCQSVSEAGSVLASLHEICNGWMGKLVNDSEDHFMEKFFTPMWNDEETSGYNQIQELVEVEESTEFVPGEPYTPEGKAACIRLATLMVACAYCIQAFKAEMNSSYAWSYVADANRWLGILQGLMSDIGGNSKKAASELGKKGADAAHSENRAMKALVMDWCDKNMVNHRSMDAAAENVAGKLVPVKFRTAREWIGEWKKLRSSGKP